MSVCKCVSVGGSTLKADCCITAGVALTRDWKLDVTRASRGGERAKGNKERQWQDERALGNVATALLQPKKCPAVAQHDLLELQTEAPPLFATSIRGGHGRNADYDGVGQGPGLDLHPDRSDVSNLLKNGAKTFLCD